MAAKAPEQLKIAGTERQDRIPELEALAEGFREIEDAYQSGKLERSKIIERIVEFMRAHELERYVYEDRAGVLQELSVESPSTRVRLKRVRVAAAPKPPREPDEPRN